ncbi:MAG: hypothetical protein AB8G11_00625 [Saprospiraceae bacterium]
MKHFVLLLPVLLLISCTSKLDKPENEPLMLDNAINPNLKISVEAFIENPENRTYLDANCIKSNEDSDFDFTYSKDSSYIEFRNDNVSEVVIKSKGQFLNYGIEIGQKRQDFETIFLRLFNNEKRPYMSLSKDKIELSCCQVGESVWIFNFKDNRLKSIYFTDSRT